MRRGRHFNPTAHLVLGISLVLWGVLITLNNLHLLRARDYLHYWPVFLIVLGLVQLSQAKTGAGLAGGGMWLVFGSLLLANTLGFVHANITSYWPLFLVFAGGRMIAQAFYRGHPGDPARAESGSVTSAVAALGRVDRRITAPDFQHGEVTAFMGACRLDLREATLAGGEAVVNVVAMMGGCELLIPAQWNVVNELTPFLGGVDDKRRAATIGADAPRLILRGVVLMGGVEIKDS